MIYYTILSSILSRGHCISYHADSHILELSCMSCRVRRYDSLDGGTYNSLSKPHKIDESSDELTNYRSGNCIDGSLIVLCRKRGEYVISSNV